MKDTWLHKVTRGWQGIQTRVPRPCSAAPCCGLFRKDLIHVIRLYCLESTVLQASPPKHPSVVIPVSLSGSFIGHLSRFFYKWVNICITYGFYYFNSHRRILVLRFWWTVMRNKRGNVQQLLGAGRGLGSKLVLPFPTAPLSRPWWEEAHCWWDPMPSFPDLSLHLGPAAAAEGGLLRPGTGKEAWLKCSCQDSHFLDRKELAPWPGRGWV